MAKELINKLKKKLKMSSEKQTDEPIVDQEAEETNEALNEQEESLSEIEELKTQVGEAKDKYLRLFAEFENYKKRNTKERLDLMLTAGQETMRVILPVLDDFDRAKQSAEDDSTTEQLSEGVLMVYDKIYSVLGNKGLKPMVSTGEKFDPELHEAISELPAASEDQKGIIIDTVERGFYLNDKIIRFAKVVVGK